LLLDHVESRLLWPHLRAGEAAGIPLVSTQKGFSVSFAQEGVVTAEVVRTEDGDLSVSAEVSLDGRRVDAATVRVIGSSGLFAVTSLGARVAVTLAELPLSAPVRALLAARGPLTVPAAEEPV